jgi:hypothetical protein
MLVTLSGIVTLVSPVHSSNAPPPMLVTLSGIVTLVSPVQPRNASPRNGYGSFSNCERAGWAAAFTEIKCFPIYNALSSQLLAVLYMAVL